MTQPLTATDRRRRRRRRRRSHCLSEGKPDLIIVLAAPASIKELPPYHPLLTAFDNIQLHHTPGPYLAGGGGRGRGGAPSRRADKAQNDSCPLTTNTYSILQVSTSQYDTAFDGYRSGKWSLPVTERKGRSSSSPYSLPLVVLHIAVLENPSRW
jgi:hypothetical protein